MFNLVWADLFKMYRSSMIKIIFGITTLCAVAMAVMAYLIPQGKIDPGMTGIGFMFSDINMISILGAVMAGVYICGDFDNKSIHNAVACGCRRSFIVVSKAIVFFCAIAFIIFPYAIITGIALNTGSKFSMGSVAVGFLNILTQNSGLSYQAPDFLKLLVIMLTLVIVYAAQLSICMPLAIVLKKPVLVVAIYYGFSILCAQLTGLRDSSPVFESIFSSTPYGGDYSLLTMAAGTGDIVKAISVSLVTIIVMLTVTYSIFRKSEVK
ncbi:MAG: ABC transporter permease [Bacillota bacterium]